jgi:hypothetical protein
METRQKCLLMHSVAPHPACTLCGKHGALLGIQVSWCLDCHCCCLHPPLLQVFQAYEQRLPARAVVEMTRRSAIAPGEQHSTGGCASSMPLPQRSLLGCCVSVLCSQWLTQAELLWLIDVLRPAPIHSQLHEAIGHALKQSLVTLA